MEYRILGKSDLKISRLGFGSMSLQADNPQNERLLHQALERGINYFDTADLYQQGGNESILGRAFKGKRDRIVLATKVGNQWRSDGSGWDWNPSRKYIMEAVEESLKRLVLCRIISTSTSCMGVPWKTRWMKSSKRWKHFKNLEKSGTMVSHPFGPTLSGHIPNSSSIIECYDAIQSAGPQARREEMLSYLHGTRDRCPGKGDRLPKAC